MSKTTQDAVRLELPPGCKWTSNGGKIECSLVVGTFEPCGVAIERDYEDEDGKYVCEFITDPRIVCAVGAEAWWREAVLLWNDYEAKFALEGVKAYKKFTHAHEQHEAWREAQMHKARTDTQENGSR